MPDRISDSLYSGSLKRKTKPTNVAAKNLQDLQDLLDPSIVSRATIAPWGRDKQGVGQWAVPGIVAGAMKALDQTGEAMRLPPGTSPDHPAYKGVFDVAGGINLPSLLRKGATSTVGMNLWHGGPNKWAAEPGFPQGRPRLDKMGSGEGAQAYGHGFYSAEKRAVADDYNKKLTGMRSSSAKRQLDKFDGDVDAAILKANQEIKRLLSIPNEMLGGNPRMRDGQIRINEEKIQELLKLKQSGEFSEGSLYKIDIPDEDIAKYIDWDAPLSAQPDFIKQALSGIMEPNFRVYPKGQKEPVSQKFETQAEADSFLKSLGDDASVYEVKGSGDAASGAEIYRKLIDIHGSPEKASEFLKSVGIPGNKYLDHGSRRSVEVFVDGKKTTPVGARSIAEKESGWLVGQLVDRGAGAMTLGANTKEAILKEAVYHDLLIDKNELNVAVKKAIEFMDRIKAGKMSRNYVTWDQKVLDRAKVLQRNEEIYKQLEKSGVPFA